MNVKELLFDVDYDDFEKTQNIYLCYGDFKIKIGDSPYALFELIDQLERIKKEVIETYFQNYETADEKGYFESTIDLITLGKSCAVELTGLPEDAEWVNTPEKALKTIKICLEKGKKADNALKNIKLSLEDDNAHK